MKNKKDLKEVGKKIETAMETLEKKLDDKVLPKIKGKEMPILIAMCAMILAGLSIKMLVFGVIVLAILLSPKYMDKIMSMAGKKDDKEETVDKKTGTTKGTKKDNPEK